MKSIGLGVATLTVLLIIGGTIYFAVRSGRSRPAGTSSDRDLGQPAQPLAEVEVEVEIEGERMMLMPSSASAARAERIGLPASGSEDVSRLLAAPRVQTRNRDIVEEQDYRPNDAIDWVVDVEFKDDLVVSADAISKLFGDAWIKSHGQPQLYGWFPEEGHWTYLVSSDAPKSFSKLAFGWSLHDPLSEETVPVDASDLERFHSSVKGLAEHLGVPRVRINRSARDAARLSREIADLVSVCNREVTVVLAAPGGKLYDGRDIWDVMLCLGLRWGDMDLFHWQNGSDVGDDYYFSVWTSTPPGYFLPERIAAKHVQVSDLVFGFSIPRSPAPVMVFDSMLEAVEYAQRRLGGELHDAQGQRLDAERVRREIRAVVDTMNAGGFKPGDDCALRVF